MDDHSGRFDEALRRELEIRGVVVRRLDRNSGIAFSLNEAIGLAHDLWLPDFYLTLDQDSAIAPDYIENALATFNRATAAGIRVGAVTAASYNGQKVLADKPLEGFDRPFDAWQSGMLISQQIWSTLGSFAADMFIDGVDSEYTLRMKKLGFEVLVGSNCDIEHGLGEQREGRLFGVHRSYTFHSPLRVYYMARNSLFLVKRYGASSPLWLLRKAAHDVRNHATRLAFSDRRQLLARAILLGVRDGVLGRTGPAGTKILNQLAEN
jgi:rhamnosyltransferase